MLENVEMSITWDTVKSIYRKSIPIRVVDLTRPEKPHPVYAKVVAAEELKGEPRYILYAEPISPLYHSQDGVDKLIFAAKHNIPVIYIASPMMGASSPATMAGCIA